MDNNLLIQVRELIAKLSKNLVKDHEMKITIESLGSNIMKMMIETDIPDEFSSLRSSVAMAMMTDAITNTAADDVRAHTKPENIDMKAEEFADMVHGMILRGMREKLRKGREDQE